MRDGEVEQCASTLGRKSLPPDGDVRFHLAVEQQGQMCSIRFTNRLTRATT